MGMADERGTFTINIMSAPRTCANHGGVEEEQRGHVIQLRSSTSQESKAMSLADEADHPSPILGRQASRHREGPCPDGHVS